MTLSLWASMATYLCKEVILWVNVSVNDIKMGNSWFLFWRIRFGTTTHARLPSSLQVTIFLRRLHTPDFTRLTDSDSLTSPKRSLLIAWIGSLQGPSLNYVHTEGGGWPKKDLVTAVALILHCDSWQIGLWGENAKSGRLCGHPLRIVPLPK